MKFTIKKYLTGMCAAAISLITAALVTACGGSSDADSTSIIQPAVEPTPINLSMEKIAGYVHTGGLGAAEISAYDPLSRRLFVINGAQASVDVLSMTSTGSGASATLSVSLIGSLTSAQFGANLGGINSVAIYNGIVALAVEAATKTDAGLVAFVRASDLTVLGTRTVGALPDMLTFSPNGRFLLVANEGEPNSYGQVGSVDPEGSVSVIEITGLSPTTSTLQMTVTNAGFTSFNTQAAALRAQGVRLPGIGTTTVAQDLEPEYITISEDNSTAWITLQENNAIAVLDIASKSITSIRALGLKDNSLPGNGLDVSDEDGGTNTNAGTPTIKISNYPIKSMYMPDGITSFRIGTRTFLATANEGDAREYVGVTTVGATTTVSRDDPRVKEYCTSGFDSSVYGTLTATMGLDSNLGRLRIDAFAGSNRTGKMPLANATNSSLLVRAHSRSGMQITWAWSGIQAINLSNAQRYSTPPSPSMPATTTTPSTTAALRRVQSQKASSPPNSAPRLLLLWA